jgi:hypothetical protein
MDVLWNSPQTEKARILAQQLHKLLGLDMYPLILKVLANNAEEEDNMGPEVLLDNMESLIKGIHDRTRYYKRLEEENVQLKLLLNTTLNIVNTLTIPELRAKQQQTMHEKENALTTKKILSLRTERRDSYIPAMATQQYDDNEEEEEDEYSDDESDISSYHTEEEDEDYDPQHSYSEPHSPMPPSPVPQSPKSATDFSPFGQFHFPPRQNTNIQKDYSLMKPPQPRRDQYQKKATIGRVY